MPYDPAVPFQNKSGVEDETLLSALTEMLENVEDDQTSSPFDTLPVSTLLVSPGGRGGSVVGQTLEHSLHMSIQVHYELRLF